ncbi:histone-like nucleoid-structuring protein [Xanthomonas campestris pv. campestris]|uniref:DNA-binding protein H-NS-like C-terminal domain-containing protein n=1 Tax=Xanthomonas campestris pv. campestris (strain B100) TaxID=509169 RepID=B0RPM6_XANCB|nr:H-NS family nucleoid-associated regulatory protein [Xanthomonas campestris]MEA0626146.1 H-NS family nucleoid-associated regulatory protein [Xanthomonas campestris pv. campestris]MEA0667201.1 H-NS family nucleoid-associated regulatory protein [Xanthomonas campestris pv. campestris]MEA0675550.1 H-NS family nucleoid-associated regulatory protein [Xanthomonas campestris pv. campestris]MEA0704465.1 H-NS family nucleoid-associated regulatory protein [Xanthomonas campestris pv. campestris]MEA07232
MALTTLNSIDAEIKQLEARKRLIEKRDADVPKALEVLQKYAQVLTAVQRRQVAKLIGDAVPAAVQVARKGGGLQAGPKGRKLGPVAPKYRIPSGETWAGRGRMPIAFTAWFASVEGKDWKKANPGLPAPLIGGHAKAKKAVKVSKAVVKKTGRKAVKKGRTKAAG